jgi:hypothetical protein
MRRLATFAVVAVLISPAAASGQDYTFGDWARDQGYSPGDVMPDAVWAVGAGIDSLGGIGDFNWTTRPTWYLNLSDNQISSIESGAFSGLANLFRLLLGQNTALGELDLAEADFSSMNHRAAFDVGGNVNITSVSLRNTTLNQGSLAMLLHGGWMHDGPLMGFGELDGITEMDLSGIDFVNITDLSPLYGMDDLTDLWMVNTQNVDATALDVLLDNLETIEGTDTEGILYMTQADFDAFNTAGGGLLAAWNAEPGHHVEYLLLGDVNHDSEVNGLDVDPFVDVLLASRFDAAADMNADGEVNGLDVDPFVEAVVAGAAQSVPEPSTLFLCIIALGVVGISLIPRRDVLD